MFDHSFPACNSFLGGDTLYIRTKIIPQWHSELRGLSANVPWQVACELVPGQRHKSAYSDFVELRTHACLCVTRQLSFWQNDRGLLRATTVTRGWNVEPAHKVDSGEENSPTDPARIRTRDLSITSPALLPTSQRCCI